VSGAKETHMSKPGTYMPHLLLLMGVAVSAAIVPARGQSASPGLERSGATKDIDKGRRLFMKYGCYECHGAEGQGSTTGPRLGHNPLPLPGFTRYIRQPKQQMPPYTAKVLSDADAADIHAFLRARSKPAARETTDELQ
jgi:mono/diheme cytochrome c family protein